ncbi:MAG: DNA starvation/stationary phase protection protein [Spirochaetaceae bacterium]|nr:DNA starvation/stationary phase protection protein [Spirochaetaceae bacterium]
MKNEVAEKLEVYLANIAISYVKMHNLHWNIKGTQFKAVHEYLEELYNAYGETMDQVAELMRMQNHIPPASMKEYLKLATIKELEGNILDTRKALEIVLLDIMELKSHALDIRLKAAAEDCFEVMNMMEDNIAEYSKNIWFIKSMLE